MLPGCGHRETTTNEQNNPHDTEEWVGKVVELEGKMGEVGLLPSHYGTHAFLFLVHF